MFLIECFNGTVYSVYADTISQAIIDFAGKHSLHGLREADIKVVTRIM